MTTALKAYASLTKEQRAVLSKTLNEFVRVLKEADSILNERAWNNRANWSSEEWDLWETWGWYRAFCRAVSIRLMKLFSENMLNVFHAVRTVPKSIFDFFRNHCLLRYRELQ